MWRPVILLLVCGGLLSGCRRFPDPDTTTIAETRPVQWLGRLDPSFDFISKATGRTHRVRVYLPAGYDASVDRYPVLYMTDAQWAFPFYAETLDWKHREVVLIGVDMPSEYRRFIDFTPLGADDYLRFFTQELIPAMEQKYRAGPERTYMGVSLGGLLGAIQLSREPVGAPFFKHYLLFDSSLGYYPDRSLTAEASRRAATEEMNLTLVLTGANPGNHALVTAFAERYRQRAYRGLVVHHKDYDVHHNGIAAPSFSDAVDLVFPPRH